MTQGMVTITKNQQVMIKIIAGSNGYNAKRLADTIKKIGESVFLLPLLEIYEISKNSSFGSEDDLVVMNSKEELFLGDEDLSPCHRKNFHLPEFNSRLDSGFPEYLEVVSF